MVADVPYVERWYYLPLPLADRHGGVEWLREQCTLRPLRVSDEVPEPISFYDESVPGYIGLPIDWACQQFQYDVEDRTSRGSGLTFYQMPDPSDHRAAPGQAEFMDSLHTAVQDNFAVTALAPTGAGKTVVSLATAAKLGRTTLVMTHLTRLGKQWCDEIHTHLGIPYEDVGWIQQNKEDWRGKGIVVGMMPTLVRRRYDPEFYRYFGTVIIDEVDVIGTEYLIPCLSMFPAAHRWVMTATWKRRDGTHDSYLNFYGQGQVRATVRRLRPKVIVKTFPGRIPDVPQDPALIKHILGRSRERNEMLTETIMGLWRQGRTILVMCHAVKHAQTLLGKVVAAGVPRDQVGQYTSVRKLESGKQQKISRAELDDVQQNAKIIFATHGMMKRGIDIPRLDAGVCAVPFSTATQEVGRIQRPYPDKQTPAWVTIKDTYPVCVRMFNKRLTDYREMKAEVIYT